MNMFARFDENPAMPLQYIKETKRYGQTHAWTDNLKTKFAGGIINVTCMVSGCVNMPVETHMQY